MNKTSVRSKVVRLGKKIRDQRKKRYIRKITNLQLDVEKILRYKKKK